MGQYQACNSLLLATVLSLVWTTDGKCSTGITGLAPDVSECPVLLLQQIQSWTCSLGTAQ